MKNIIKKIEDLKKEIEDFKPERSDKLKHQLVKSYIILAANVASYQSRVKPGGYNLAGKLNDQYKTEEPTAEQKKIISEKNKIKRGRPKKNKTNVMSDSNINKNLTEKLKNND
jgi:hypothetical protein